MIETSHERIRPAHAPWIAILCLFLLPACASQRSPVQVEDLLGQALRAAVTHHEFDMDPEAAVLLEGIHAVDPEFPGARELEEDLEPGARRGLERTPLGMNRKMRPRLTRSPQIRALLWLPDRLLDLLDVVTFGVHLGPGAFADVHVTRAVQVAGGFHTTGGLGLHDFRSLGMRSQGEAGLTVVTVGTHAYGGALIGTSGVHAGSDASTGLHLPTAPLYQDLRDYWAVGANATAGIIGAEAEFHPLQVADFLAGFVGIDLLNDDFARTRGLKLDPVESKLLAELWRIKGSRRTLAAYREAKDQGILSMGNTPGTLPGPVAEETEVRFADPSSSDAEQTVLSGHDTSLPASEVPARPAEPSPGPGEPGIPGDRSP